MRFNLRSKLLVLCLAVAVVSLSSSLFFRHFILRDFYRYVDGESQDRIHRVASMLEGNYEKQGGWNAAKLHDDVSWALQMGLEVVVRDASGREIASSRNTVASLSPLMGKRVRESTGFEPGGSAGSIDTVPLFLSGENIGELDARVFNPVKEEYYIAATRRFLIYSLAALGLSATLLAAFAARRLARPLVELSDAAAAVADGNMGRRVLVRGSDEIAVLAKDFNLMADRLELQEKLRKKLLSGTAHELRTPLAIISGELEGMIDGVLPVTEQSLRSMHEEAERLAGILNGIDELTRAESSIVNLQKEVISLGQFLTAISGRFDRLFSEKGAALMVECPASLYVEADPDRLSQIVINLLSNACKATGNGGRAVIAASQSGDRVEIVVSDDGLGIDPEDLPHIFERFYKGTGEGMGLGLAIVRELVNAHGGTVEAVNRASGGAAVTVRLPQGDVLTTGSTLPASGTT